MNKVTIRSLFSGLILLGIGCIAWSMLGILSQPKYSISANDVSNFNFNNSLNEENTSKTEATKVRYLPYPLVGEKIGMLTIPALEEEFSIIQGTGEKELKKGVGHFLQSVLPGETDNSVLSGHRETVFKNQGNLVIGDLLILTTSAGVFTYTVESTRIVAEDDKTVIVSSDDAILTLTTCYPFLSLKKATERYIVSATLVKE